MTAGDGRAALRAIEEHAPRLVVLDLMLPEIDGLAVIRPCARAERRRPDPRPVGAWGGRRPGRWASSEGADDYLPKPFSPAELVARVRTILRRTERALDDEPAATLRSCGDLELDRDPPPGDAWAGARSP